MSQEKRKFIIDTDAGVDDAQAILLALTNPDVDVIGITCVAGNADVHQVGLNVLRILKVVNRLDIPVYVGCDDPLLGDAKPMNDYHGKDGFGDAPDEDAPDDSYLSTEHAVPALIRITKQYKDEITLCCIGPLSNIAVAIRMDAQFGQRLTHCYIMGGNHEGKGNMTPAAEFNFYADPEAAYVVLNQLKSPISIVTWETCDNHALPWTFYHKTRDPDTPINNFLRKIERHSAQYAEDNNWGFFVPADEVLIACALNADVIKTCSDVYATVDTKGQITWGQMVVDWKSLLQKPNNVRIITDVNHDIYEKMIEALPHRL